MDKNFRIYAGRPSLIGDTIMFLPVLNYLEIKYPNSYKIFPISKKTCQSVELFINHPLIDKLYVMDAMEGLTQKDADLIHSCRVAINPFPQHPPCPGLTVGIDNFWYNKYTCIDETIRMAGLDLEDFKKIPEELQKPILEQWFPFDRFEKTIGLWLTAGYGKEPKRSPSREYIRKLIPMLLKEGYTIIRFGHPNDPDLGTEYPNYYGQFRDFRHKSFFDQIKLSLGCSLCINTDSGSGWVLGGYGHKQISLLTNHAPNHTENPLAFAPINYKNNNINLLNSESCDKIPQELVLESIKKLI